MTIVAEKPVAGGECLARIDGKAVFVPFVLPGETAEIEIVEERKDWSRARLVRVLEESPRRVAPPCPLFGTCGGCSMQMAESGYQTELRLAVAADSLRRAGSAYSGPIDAVAGEPYGYRSRAQFHPCADGSPGFSAARSSETIAVKDCPILVDPIRGALADGSLARAMREAFPPGADREGREGRGQFRGTRRSRSRGGFRVPESDNRRFHVFASGGKLFHEAGITRAEAVVGPRRLAFDVRGFFQSNLPLLERLAGAATADIPAGASLLDFYAGVGTFSAFASGSVGRSTLVEHNASALEFARENVPLSGESLALCALSDEAWSRHPLSRERYDVAIVDPPRQGLARPALDWFAASLIPDLRYVSCDPVTFARDAALLEKAGYTLESLTLFDFYPQTHHAEVYGRFVR